MGKFVIPKQDSVKLYKIRKTLEELSKKSGRGTELITVYIPKGKQLHEIIGSEIHTRPGHLGQVIAGMGRECVTL